jgi:energy-coupling factor transporter ATP-binding protein EcfA2
LGIRSIYLKLLLWLYYAEAMRARSFQMTVRALLRESGPVKLRSAAALAIEGLSRSFVRKAFEADLEHRIENSLVGSQVYAEVLAATVSWTGLQERELLPKTLSQPAARLAEELLVEAERFCKDHGLSREDVQIYTLREYGSDKGVRADEVLSRTSDASISSALRILLSRAGVEQFRAKLEEIPDELQELRRNRERVNFHQRQARKAQYWKPALRLQRIEIESLRCFESAGVDLNNDANERAWNMLLGDNGFGKTTFLRCIAIGLSDQAGAASLIKRLGGAFTREGGRQGSIRVILSDEDGELHWTHTHIANKPDGSVEVTQTRSPQFDRNQIFLCAYGALRSGFGTEDFATYQIERAVDTLFDPKATLQNPELTLRRMSGEDMNDICRCLEEILTLKSGSVQISSSGIAMRGPWGTFTPMAAVGDGYQATLTWITDFLGWAFAYNSTYLTSDISGIVLVDEIEKHLHPRWQRYVIGQLSRQFPNVQFVVSTHSPICAGGLSDLKDGMGTIFHFKAASADTVAIEQLQPLAGWRYDQIITSEAFGLSSARDVSTENIVNELRSARESGDGQRALELSEQLARISRPIAEEEKDRDTKDRFTRILNDLNSSRDDE